MTDQFTDPIRTPTTSGYPAAGTGARLNGAAILAQEQASGSFGQAADDPPVLRGRVTSATPRLPVPGRTPYVGWNATKNSTLSRFNAEFFERWQDVNFQTWLQSRQAATDGKNANPTVEGAYAFWVNAGKATVNARGVRWTPEQYIEYMANGGTLKKSDEIVKDITTGSYVLDANGQPITFDSVLAEGTPNPITTQRNVTYNTVNPLAANAAVDKMSQALLGRMATKSEMARMRGAINSILKKNPDVATATRDATDPDNVNVTTKTKAGMTAPEAEDVIQMRMQRSSEGMAAGVGNLFEAALRAL